MDSGGADAARILSEIEALKATKSGIEAKISALEAQLQDLNCRNDAVSSNGSCPLATTVDSGLGHGLSPEMIYRYSRQLLLPSFGVQGSFFLEFVCLRRAIWRLCRNRWLAFDLLRICFNFVALRLIFAAQSNLLKSSILVVGAGGLGSPALLYLAACGVGMLWLLTSCYVFQLMIDPVACL